MLPQQVVVLEVDQKRVLRHDKNFSLYNISTYFLNKIMPHLQFEINKKLNKKSKKNFISFVEESFSKIMETGKDHIAISIRELEENSISLGRAKNEYICLMNLDIRSGRTDKQKLKLIKTLISGVEKFFFIKKNTNMSPLQIMKAKNLFFMKNH